MASFHIYCVAGNCCEKSEREREKRQVRPAIWISTCPIRSTLFCNTRNNQFRKSCPLVQICLKNSDFKQLDGEKNKKRLDLRENQIGGRLVLVRLVVAESNGRPAQNQKSGVSSRANYSTAGSIRSRLFDKKIDTRRVHRVQCFFCLQNPARLANLCVCPSARPALCLSCCSRLVYFLHSLFLRRAHLSGTTNSILYTHIPGLDWFISTPRET